jgi:hypothetical protein
MNFLEGSQIKNLENYGIANYEPVLNCQHDLYLLNQTEEVIKEEKKIEVVPFSNLYAQNAMKFIIAPGNNSKLVREAMK